MCTIADAKVQRNYNCYNVYFYECLRIFLKLNIIGKSAITFSLSLLEARQLHLHFVTHSNCARIA